LQSRVLQLRPPGSSCGPSSALQATPGARSRVPGVCPDSSSVTSPLSCVCVLYRGYQVGSYKGWPGPAGFRVWPRSSHVRKSGIRSCAMLRVPPTPCPGSPRVPALPPFPLERACGFSAVARGWHSLRARGRARADLRRRYQDHQDHQDLFLRYPHEHLFS
jgi:hypothetical protein